MTRLKFKDFLIVEEAPSAEETLTPGPVRSIRDHDHEKELLKKRQVSPVYKDDKIEVLKLRGRDAAIYYGSGTHWGQDVRFNENYFDEFIKPNNPYLALTIKGRKYLIYPGAHEVYNEAFKEVNAYQLVKKHPELRHALEELAEKHKWPAFMKREPTAEELEHVRTRTRKFHHLDAENLPSETLANDIKDRSKGLDELKLFLEGISYEKALDVLKHSDYRPFMNAFLNFFHSKRGRSPVEDAYEALKDKKDQLSELAEVVFRWDNLHAPLVLPQAVELGLIESLSKYELGNVLKNYQRQVVKLSDAGWNKITELAPDAVLELHKENKSLVPQKFLQRAQWHKFKQQRPRQ